MDILSLLLGAQNQERSVTIKTKPNQEKGPPERPLDGQSANLPPEVLAMLSQMGAGGGPEEMMPPSPSAPNPMMGQIPMDMAQNPYAMALGG